MELFPSRLKTLRSVKGLTQGEMAQLLGIQPTMYRRYESGSTAPSLDTAIKISEKLGISFEEFLFPTNRSVRKPLYWDLDLDNKLASIGCSTGFDEEGHSLWINFPDGTIEVTEEQLKQIDKETDSFLRFKLHELKEKNPGKFRPAKPSREE